jgi:hypothetical protein
MPTLPPRHPYYEPRYEIRKCCRPLVGGEPYFKVVEIRQLNPMAQTEQTVAITPGRGAAEAAKRLLDTKAPMDCGCHCEGGCGDPFAACMYPCDEHVPY